MVATLGTLGGENPFVVDLALPMQDLPDPCRKEHG